MYHVADLVRIVDSKNVRQALRGKSATVTDVESRPVYAHDVADAAAGREVERQWLTLDVHETDDGRATTVTLIESEVVLIQAAAVATWEDDGGAVPAVVAVPVPVPDHVLEAAETLGIGFSDSLVIE